MSPAAALALLALAATPPAADEPLLPADSAVPGCTRSGAAETYTGAELYGLIDGGAELFLECGFVRATVQRYRTPGGDADLELYRMRDPVAALGIYLAKCGRETPDPALAARHTIGRLQLQLVRADLYVLLTADAAAAGTREALLALARAVTARVPETAAPAALAALPRDGLLAGSERLVRGPLALAALITLGAGDVLDLQANGLTAAAAEYAAAGGVRFIRLLADYPTAEAAAAALAGAAANLDPYLTAIEHGTARLVFRDHAGRFGAITISGARLELLANLAAPPR